MEKKKLFDSEDGEEYFVMKKEHGNKYYVRDLLGEEYEISKKNLKNIIKEDFGQYGYIDNLSNPEEKTEGELIYENIEKLAPELLPTNIEVMANNSSEQPKHCLPGYVYVKSYVSTKGFYRGHRVNSYRVNSYCRKKK